MMPIPADGGYPDAAHVVAYLTDYEQRYRLPIVRPAAVRAVRRAGPNLAVDSSAGTWHARIVVSATGTWWRPYVPHYPGIGDFRGEQLHTAGYRGPGPFRDRRVLVVGGGNSAAQILAELSRVAPTTWATLRQPRLLPDEIDGRALFDLATRRHPATAARPRRRDSHRRHPRPGRTAPAPARLRRLDRPRLGHPHRRRPHRPATGRRGHRPALGARTTVSFTVDSTFVYLDVHLSSVRSWLLIRHTSKC
ncbi:NAD(P)-binding domain-containing protein [Nonomuraea sp. NPDC051191]|uniref:NAD(P)-binding domain-containing protein n=1 Tax=Nonomuraea sp. NPDC051191 TaxID=3364372 RepID=UPI00379D7B37